MTRIEECNGNKREIMVDAPKYANVTFTYAPTTTTTDHAMLKYKSKRKTEVDYKKKRKKKTNNLRHRIFAGCQ